jgi:hypothetical protein
VILTARLPGDDYQELDQRQMLIERRALTLAAAWSDFHVVEETAAEVVRRFGMIEPRDLWVIRLHKHPLFVALQSACVTGYTRPFLVDHGLGQVAEKYCTYTHPEWEELHEDLFVWRERLSGDGDIAFRQFVVARNDSRHRDAVTDRYVIGEATRTLEPLKHFALLQEMCADRKALIWPDLENALTECYPFMAHPVLLSLGNKNDNG